MTDPRQPTQPDPIDSDEADAESGAGYGNHAPDPAAEPKRDDTDAR